MNNPSTSCEARMAGLLDRLVCGELEETARRQLLAWLEEDHEHWRLCGLAFLEAQTWSQVWARPIAQQLVLGTQY